MSAEITSAVWGLAPWSDDLLKISGDVERGRAPQIAFDEQLNADFTAYHNSLETAEINYRSGWRSGVRDYFRVIVSGSRGFEDGIQNAPVTRWFDTNTFYRQPTINGPLDYFSGDRHDYYELWLKTTGGLATYQPTFLSPYAFAKLSQRSAEVSEAQALNYVTELYDQLLDSAARQNVTEVLLHEPFAPYHKVDETERNKLGFILSSLARNHPGLGLGVYFSFGDGAGLVRQVAEDDAIQAVGCDLKRTAVDSLPQVGQRFFAGLVDGANTLIDEDADITAGVEQAASVTNAPGITLTHTVDLEFVPRDTALLKVQQIGRVARSFQGGNK